MKSLPLAALLLPSLAFGALQISPNHRYLVDNGAPFFLTGDAAWSLIAQLTTPDALVYLDDRESKGFNLVMVNLIEHQFSSNPPANAYGDAPFTGAPFATPNEAYFAHVDDVIEAAAARGITVLLAPVYLGYGCGSEGWCAEVQAASNATMRNWGRYLGARYAGFDNLVWMIGGDTDPAPVAGKLREVVSGIREHDTVHLFTAHNDPETQAITRWPGESWLTVNNVYTYSSALYQEIEDAYAVSPAIPCFLVESAYENEHGSTPQTLRAQSYWAATSGAFGHVFGDCPIWHFGYSTGWCGMDDWQSALDGPGSNNMTYYRRLFESRRWTRFVPDLGHSVMTAGFGTYGSSTYATTAYADDGSSIVAYLPSRRTVTIAMSTLSGSSIHAWWFNPGNGSASDLGTFPHATRSFLPPSTGDWVLVIDDDALGLPAPGTPPSTTVADLEAQPSWNAAPNPFDQSVQFTWTSRSNGRAELRIYSALGRLVRSLSADEMLSGPVRLTWDGRDSSGRPLETGIYFARLRRAGSWDERKLIRIR